LFKVREKWLVATSPTAARALSAVVYKRKACFINTPSFNRRPGRSRSRGYWPLRFVWVMPLFTVFLQAKLFFATDIQINSMNESNQ